MSNIEREFTVSKRETEKENEEETGKVLEYFGENGEEWERNKLLIIVRNKESVTLNSIDTKFGNNWAC